MSELVIVLPTLSELSQPSVLLAMAGIWLGVTNLWSIYAFWLDKRRAMAGEWRLPEALLLFGAFLDGSAGAKLAQHWFRHKTRKEPFRSNLNRIVQGQLVLALVMLLAAAILVALQGPPGLASAEVADPVASASEVAPRQSPVPPRNPRG